MGQAPGASAFLNPRIGVELNAMRWYSGLSNRSGITVAVLRRIQTGFPNAFALIFGNCLPNQFMPGRPEVNVDNVLSYLYD